MTPPPPLPPPTPLPPPLNPPFPHPFCVAVGSEGEKVTGRLCTGNVSHRTNLNFLTTTVARPGPV